MFALVVNARDDATTASRAQAPGEPGRAPIPTARALVADGNVVVLSGAADRPALGRLVQEITGVRPGPDQDALVRAGQGIELGAGGDGAIEAYGGDRVLRVEDPGDPGLRRFLEFWLGRTVDG